MHSKSITVVTVLGILIGVACSDSNDGSQSPKIGVPLQQAYSAFTGSVGTAFENNEAVFLDSAKKQVILFQVEPFEVTSTLDLPDGVDSEAFFAGRNNQFFILKEKRGFGILKRGGAYLKSPVPMFGEITAVSYDYTSGRLIVQDNLSSVALIRLSDAGDVIASWIGGPIIDGENGILAGTLLRSGTIAVSMTDHKLAKIDFDASLAAGSWSFTRFDFPLSTPSSAVAGLSIWSDDEDEFDYDTVQNAKRQDKNEDWVSNFSVDADDSTVSTEQKGVFWLSPVDSLDHVVMARSAEAIYTIDFDSMTLADTVLLAANETGLHFNRNSGHVIISDGSLKNHFLVHAGPDGKLLRKKIHNIPVAGVEVNRNVEFSVMDALTGTLTVMAGVNGQRTIFRNRLSDGLFVGAVDVKNFERTVLTNQHVIEIFDYELGKAVRSTIQNPDDKVEVKAYNLRQTR